ncbi:aminopeptidase [Irregularibacter muris]|uniref:Aminopeptidase n=1 Tax=Irregularibacter muris TaxID=1796619 RepID=A0AAE3HH35_9FIRM|nr:aminopeptidase [Irregularibacter muris]MCR1899319.1 aminopeptidase [Irregularibacter muris]
MKEELLKKYARLLVKKGLNLQKDQILVIGSPVECADFTRVVAEIAYKEGAHDVVINWNDEKFSKVKYLHAPEKVFEEFPQWRKDMFLDYSRQGAAFLSIAASDPELMKDVDPQRMATASKTASIALKEHQENLMANKNTWCVASIPTKSWAEKVFPELKGEEAIEKLWDTIFKTVRVDKEDPVAAWEEHLASLKRHMEILNKHNFKTLHYKNSLGTDLTIELPENHLWLGGSEFTPKGVEFIANMPTEEVFTLPKKTGVNGKVVSSKPLNYNGNLIENFTLTFKDGKIVEFDAQEGYETLKTLIETDQGSHYLGEVALVPYDSPISNSNILFYNTLFDENASCHLAIGKAYPVCVKNGENMTPEELEKAGVNDSLTHEDFMVGTKDLEIIGVTQEGKEIQVFKNGNFAF